jgi:hypothetical protein
VALLLGSDSKVAPFPLPQWVPIFGMAPPLPWRVIDTGILYLFLDRPLMTSSEQCSKEIYLLKRCDYVFLGKK